MFSLIFPLPWFALNAKDMGMSLEGDMSMVNVKKEQS